MSDPREDFSRRLGRGGFSNADIPAGFEQSRSPHLDAPLSDRGKKIYYGVLAFVILGGIALLILSVR